MCAFVLLAASRHRLRRSCSCSYARSRSCSCSCSCSPLPLSSPRPASCCCPVHWLIIDTLAGLTRRAQEGRGQPCSEATTDPGLSQIAPASKVTSTALARTQPTLTTTTTTSTTTNYPRCDHTTNTFTTTPRRLSAVRTFITPPRPQSIHCVFGTPQASITGSPDCCRGEGANLVDQHTSCYI